MKWISARTPKKKRKNFPHFSICTVQNVRRGSERLERVTVDSDGGRSIVSLGVVLRKSQPDKSASPPRWSRNWVEVGEHELHIDFYFLTFFFFSFYSFTPLPCVKSKLFSSHLLPSLKFDPSWGCVPHSDWHRRPRAPPAFLFSFGESAIAFCHGGSAAVMCSFRLACQPPLNWLARLEGRYQRRAVIDSHMKRVARTTVYQRPLVGLPFHWTLRTAADTTRGISAAQTANCFSSWTTTWSSRTGRVAAHNRAVGGAGPAISMRGPASPTAPLSQRFNPRAAHAVKSFNRAARINSTASAPCLSSARRASSPFGSLLFKMCVLLLLFL